jgi:hypothetical protein
MATGRARRRREPCVVQPRDVSIVCDVRRYKFLTAPQLREFYGIVIEMYFADHPPPHFHARYGGEEATIVIASGAVLAGSLPGRALRLVREWLAEHRAELDVNWERARNHEAPEPVAPLT